MKGLSGLMALLAIAGALLALVFLSDDTWPLGVLVLCCLVGILARIVQAERHHQELLRALRERE